LFVLMHTLGNARSAGIWESRCERLGDLSVEEALGVRVNALVLRHFEALFSIGILIVLADTHQGDCADNPDALILGVGLR
jgi:hypothetical protein